MKDFTIKTYLNLLEALSKQGFSFQSYGYVPKVPENRIIILRHDVDLIPVNSLKFARIQSEKGIRGTYFFRIVDQSYDERIIKEIYSFGNEIGYHYEDVSIVTDKRLVAGGRQQKQEVINYAIESFSENLAKLRKIVPVNTICMHGSPMSIWDNRLMWKYYDYRNFGIISEPYFDVNVEEVLYLTDTGRRWDGSAVSIRDKGLGTWKKELSTRNKGLGIWEDYYRDWKVKPIQGSLMNMTQKAIDFQNKYKFRSTFDMIKAAEEGKLPDKIMMTFHPQRWTDNPVLWTRELVWQNMKNIVKYFVVKRSENT